MQLGFVIDHTQCIGCHACTVACKSENQVPLGSFRTWVKYTETGTFPEVRRDYSVLRCNQCTDAPCVTICPVRALGKGGNEIVDVDPDHCIGCKSCMHACPYDAIYLNENKGTVEKCHFCAHRTERGLAPACAIVCPTEAIIPGDFDDPESVVSRMTREFSLDARKPEAGTKPNVRYREVSANNIDPGLSNKGGGYIWSNAQGGPQMDAQTFEALDLKARGEEAQSRTVYDVPRKQLWGWKVTDYLFTKSLATGILPIAILVHLLAGEEASIGVLPAILSLIALSLCGAALVADLKRPERFLKIFLRPNFSSWLVRGSFLILAYSLLLVAWIAWSLLGGAESPPPVWGLGLPLVVIAILTAAYTGWLFAQAKGRVLWMRRFFWAHLIVQAGLAGTALLALITPLLEWSSTVVGELHEMTLNFAVLHLVFTLMEPRCAPKGREQEYERASRLLVHGPWSREHWMVAVALGTLLPIFLLLTPASYALPLAGLAILIGLRKSKDLLVRAGQALPIS